MFRFTIRDLLWLTVVVGVAFAWAIDHHRMGVLNFLAWQKVKSLQETVDVLSGSGVTLSKPMPNPSTPAQNPSSE